MGKERTHMREDRIWTETTCGEMPRVLEAHTVSISLATHGNMHGQIFEQFDLRAAWSSLASLRSILAA